MKPIRHHGSLHPQIRQDAVEWFLAFCEEEVDPAACAQFNAWLRRSPEHVRAYLRVSAFWEDAEDLKQHTRHGIEELVQRARAEGNVVALEDVKELPAPARTPGTMHKRRWVLWPTVMAAACAGVGMLAWLVTDRTYTYSTSAAEQRTLILSDGSAVELNARSRVIVRYTRPEREVDLLEGQALFRVAKDPSRPFLVDSGRTRIRAVGTQFDVYRRHDETVVTVVEGQVAVSGTQPTEAPGVTGSVPGKEAGSAATPPGRTPVLVSAGQRVVASAYALGAPQAANTTAATAWTEGKLVFDSVPLKEVLAEFNRYLPRPLVLNDPQLLEVHVSGVFSVTESRQFIEFLHRRFGTTSQETDADVRITRP